MIAICYLINQFRIYTACLKFNNNIYCSSKIDKEVYILLRDMFFYFWRDWSAGDWRIYVIALFSLLLAAVIIVIARTKALDKNFNAKHYLFFFFALLVMYQAIPALFDFVAEMYVYSNSSEEVRFNKAVKLEKMAINLSMIPYQKGGYYIRLADIYKKACCPIQMHDAYQKAFSYIKSYKYGCWNYIPPRNTYFYGYYDEALEMNLVSKNPSNTISRDVYLLKGDLENALIYANKTSLNFSTNLLVKAYILKQMGQEDEAKILYENAINSCRDIKEGNEIFDDYIGVINRKLEKKLACKCKISE